jgi:hypothetical protein
VTTASSVQFDFFGHRLLFCSRFRSACGRARLFASISIPESRPTQSFPSVLCFLSTSSLGWSSGAEMQCTAQVPAFLCGRFSSRVVLDSPCSFCLHDFSCTDFYCRCLISGFCASRARSGFGFLSSPLCFLVCVRSLPPESCSLPFHFWNLGFSFLAFSGPLVCSYWTSLSCSRWIFPFRATAALVFSVPAFRIQSAAETSLLHLQS